MALLPYLKEYFHQTVLDVSPGAAIPAGVDFLYGQVISGLGYGVHNPMLELGLIGFGNIASLHSVGRAAIAGLAWLEQTNNLERSTAQPISEQKPTTREPEL